jgi:hypothetical protein
MRLLKLPSGLSFLPFSLSLSAGAIGRMGIETATSNAHQCQHLASGTERAWLSNGAFLGDPIVSLIHSVNSAATAGNVI